jgi:hypothetical protein
MNLIKKITALSLAVWMLAISNGILLIEHYFHGELSSVNLFISENDACQSHHEVEDSCCESVCNCHHENQEGIPAPSRSQDKAALAQSLLDCCFETSSWLQLEDSSTPKSDQSTVLPLFAILYHLVQLPDYYAFSNVSPVSDDPLPNSSIPKHLLHSVFIC